MSVQSTSSLSGLSFATRGYEETQRVAMILQRQHNHARLRFTCFSGRPSSHPRRCDGEVSYDSAQDEGIHEANGAVWHNIYWVSEPLLRRGCWLFFKVNRCRTRPPLLPSPHERTQRLDGQTSVYAFVFAVHPQLYPVVDSVLRFSPRGQADPSVSTFFARGSWRKSCFVFGGQ